MLSFAYTHATQYLTLHLQGEKNKEKRLINPRDNSSPQSNACMLCLIISNDGISSAAFEKAIPHDQSSHFFSVQFHLTTPNYKLRVPT